MQAVGLLVTMIPVAGIERSMSFASGDIVDDWWMDRDLVALT